MSLLNNLNTSNNYNPVGPSQTTFLGIDSKRFAKAGSLNDLSNLLAKGDSNQLTDDELSSLIRLLREFNIDIEIEVDEDNESGTTIKMPSILSSTDAYTKLFKALAEVLAKLKEEEERRMKKAMDEMEIALHEKKIETMQTDMDKAMELGKSKEIQKEVIVDKNFEKINQFFDDLRQKYSINIKNTKNNPINTIV